MVFSDRRTVAGPLAKGLGDRAARRGPEGGLGTEPCNISTGYNQIAPPHLRRPDNSPEALGKACTKAAFTRPDSHSQRAFL